MHLKRLATATQRALHKNSQTILASIAASGVITTSYLAGRASYDSALMLLDHPEAQTPRDKAEIVWPLFIPAALSGTITVSCIFGTLKVGNRKTAAAQAALSLSERAFSEYREKVIEHFGETKEQKVRDEIAQDRVDKNPPPKQEVVMTGPGSVICCEDYTGRYFSSDMEILRKAQNDINAKLIAHDYATLDDFYYLIGLSSTSYSNDMGWTSDKLLELEFTTTLTKYNMPCIVFRYNYTKPV